MNIFSWSRWSGEPDPPRARVAVRRAHRAVALDTARARAAAETALPRLVALESTPLRVIDERAWTRERGD